jgi:hypothetical protein
MSSAANNPAIKPRTLAIIAVAATVLLVLVALVQIFLNGGFRASLTPSGGVLPTSVTVIKAEFNRPLAALEEQPEGFVRFEPAIPVNTLITDSDLVIVLEEQPDVNSEVTLFITDILAQDGSQTSIEKKYKVEFVPYTQLDGDAKELNEENSAPTDISQHPLVQILPHSELSYSIDYTYAIRGDSVPIDPDGPQDNFILVINTIARTDIDPDEYKATNLRLRDRALEWIREQGFNPEDYDILFTPDDAFLDGNESEDGGVEEFTENANTLPEEEFTGDGVPPDASFFE